MFSSNLGEDYWLSAHANSVWGACLEELGRIEEARPLLVESYAKLEAGGLAYGGRTQRARNRLQRFRDLTE